MQAAVEKPHWLADPASMFSSAGPITDAGLDDDVFPHRIKTSLTQRYRNALLIGIVAAAFLLTSFLGYCHHQRSSQAGDPTALASTWTLYKHNNPQCQPAHGQIWTTSNHESLCLKTNDNFQSISLLPGPDPKWGLCLYESKTCGKSLGMTPDPKVLCQNRKQGKITATGFKVIDTTKQKNCP